MAEWFRLGERVALVTGASRGIDRAGAHAFGVAGAAVACCARSADQIAAYCAGKGAVAALTRSLAAEWTRHSIQVNCLTPAVPGERSEKGDSRWN